MEAERIELVNVGRQEIEIPTARGLLKFKRAVLSPVGRSPVGKRCTNEWCKRTSGIIPLDEFLRINNLPMKMTRLAMTICAKFGQLIGSYKSAAETLREHTPIQVSDSTVEKATDIVAAHVVKEDTERAEQTWENMADLDWKDNARKGVFYVMIDGSMGQTREKDKETGRLMWREVRLCVMFAESDTKIRGKKNSREIMKKSYTAFVGSAEEFYKYVFDMAIECHAFEYERIIVVSDGAAWIRIMCNELFPGSQQILDYYHLAENLGNFAKYKFNNDASKITPWVKGLLYLFEHSRTDEALEKLKEFKDEKCPLGVLNPYTYVMNNRNKVDYAEYKRLGWDIGSGPVEAGNKSVVQKRCKQSGMQWNIPNLQGMVTLRSKYLGNSWGKSVCNSFLKAA